MKCKIYLLEPKNFTKLRVNDADFHVHLNLLNFKKTSNKLF